MARIPFRRSSNSTSDQPVWHQWSTPDEASPAPSSKKKRGWLIAGVVGAFVLLIAALSGRGGDDTATVETTVTQTVTVTAQAPPSTVTVTAAPPTEAGVPAPAPFVDVPGVDVPEPGLDVPEPTVVVPEPTQEIDVYYSDCAEARAAGAAPISAGEPGYRSELDRNGDGIACENA